MSKIDKNVSQDSWEVTNLILNSKTGWKVSKYQKYKCPKTIVKGLKIANRCP